MPFLVSQGLSQVEDQSMLEVFGKQVTLKQMLAMRNLNEETFGGLLEEVLEDSSTAHDVAPEKTTGTWGAALSGTPAAAGEL